MTHDLTHRGIHWNCFTVKVKCFPLRISNKIPYFWLTALLWYQFDSQNNWPPWLLSRGERNQPPIMAEVPLKNVTQWSYSLKYHCVVWYLTRFSQRDLKELCLVRTSQIKIMVYAFRYTVSEWGFDCWWLTCPQLSDKFGWFICESF